jgi:hypothetical protein
MHLVKIIDYRLKCEVLMGNALATITGSNIYEESTFSSVKNLSKTSEKPKKLLEIIVERSANNFLATPNNLCIIDSIREGRLFDDDNEKDGVLFSRYANQKAKWVKMTLVDTKVEVQY